MDPDVINFAGVMVVCLGTLWGLAFIFSFSRRQWHRGHQPEPAKLPDYDEKLAQLQHSVDAIAVEVERIAEGQRFSTRLLSEGAHARITTPDR
jgi:hypothetical protein